MFKKIVVGVAILLLVLIPVIALQPSAFAVERSTAIAAPAGVVYPHIASVRAMDVWMPWAKADPEMKTVYEGPETGVGARSAWDGPQMGKGRIAITAVKPDEQVEMRLEMRTPMEATNRVVFTLAPTGVGTSVTWRLEGNNGFVGKFFSLFMDMDTMMGGEFEKGLAELKRLAEAEAGRGKAG
jgi:hypothetical protein